MLGVVAGRRPAPRVCACCAIGGQGDALANTGRNALDWRLASCKKQFDEVNHDSETQAASVASVSAASGSFEDFSSGGVAADAKWSKLTTGASTPRAKIWWRSRLRRSCKDGRAAWRRHFGSGR